MSVREPHPFATHVAVDAAVSFLGLLVLGLILGWSILVIVAISIVLGVCLAPYTRRTEIRQLAAIEAERDLEDPEQGELG